MAFPSKQRTTLRKSQVKLLHSSVPGRARLRIKEIYRSDDVAHWLELKLKNITGVNKASANPYTSNLLIQFDPKQIKLDRMIHQINAWVQQSHNPALARQIRRYRLRTQRNNGSQKPGLQWHNISANHVIKHEKTSIAYGLSNSEAAARLDQSGLNQIPTTPTRYAKEILYDQIANLPSVLLIISAGLSLATGGISDAVLILAVVIVNTSIGYKTESSAEEIVGILSQSKIQKVQVIREGKTREIPAEYLVTGDILCLTPGTTVAADARLLIADALSADESLITGESLPVLKSVKKIKKENIPIADRVNMVFCGTLITGGDGRAVVVATGIDTEIGQIQSLIGTSARPQTALQLQLTELTQKLVIASLGFSACIFAVQLLRRQAFIESLKSAITLAVAAIPEGIPTVATTILAQAMQKLKESGVLVRRIGAIENLGTVNLLCVDKTGTLTYNKMTVTSMITPFGKPAEQTQLMKVATLCNEATLQIGSPTEKALIEMAISGGIQIDELRKSHPRIAIRHRRENRGFMSTLHKTPNQTQFLAVKGNPIEVLDRCQWYLRDGMRSMIDKKILNKIQMQNSSIAENGLRVLGFAFKEDIFDGNIDEQHLTWLGLVGMTDPLRPEVHRFLKKLRSAGVRPVMVTGDQASTALAIGKKLGLGNGKPLSVVESTHLESVFDKNADIFARVSPAHKLQIVQALQKSGSIVAMTGDGINDGPALKTANVGIAMGINGTDIARKVADIVLVKDDLYSIILAIQEGRKTRENLKKSVDYIIAQNLTEVLLTFISTVSGLGAPLSPMQLLWINLITDILPELALAQEEPEENLLQLHPEPNLAGLIPKKDAQRIGLDSALLTAASLGIYLYGIRRYGPGPEAKTLAFLSINTSSLLYTLAARSRKVTIFDRHGLEKNKYIPAAIGAGFSAEFIGTALPYLRGLLGAGKLRPIDLLIATTGSSIPLFIIEIFKFISRRMDQSTHLTQRDLLT